MNQSLRVLIVEDSDSDVDQLRRTLCRGGYEVTSAVVDTPEAMRAALAQQDWDVITSDHAMPFFSAPAALALAKELRPDVPFIIVSGEINLNLAVSLMRGGAQDYIPKGELARVVPAIARELRDVEVRRERQRVEDALHVSETRYRRLFEAARDGILIVDTVTQRITDVNPFMVELLGYTRDELLGEELWEIGVLTDAEASREAFRVLQATGYIRYDDLPLQSKAGVHRDVEFVSNIYLENGHQVIQCNIRDITARTQAEAELYALNADLEQRVRDRTAQLEALNHELEAFNASVSHDLHTPLRQIDDVVEALQDDYADRLDAASLQRLQRIRASTQRMKMLIDALLALARVSRHALEWRSVDLSALAHVVASELQHLQPTRQIDWIIADGLTTHGDPRLLHIVLDNLLSNAWKFTSTNAQTRIEVGGQPAPDGTSVWFVRDNGVGFDMAFVDRLFGAFQRLHRETEFPGTGIGLATVQRIIHRHGGRVWAEGAMNQGATFYCTIPEGTSARMLAEQARIAE
jgi:PAS domain S-box-containing protein